MTRAPTCIIPREGRKVDSRGARRIAQAPPTFAGCTSSCWSITLARRITMVRNWLSKFSALLPRLAGLAAIVFSAVAMGASPAQAESRTAQITVLYDAFGKTSTMKKDWGFAALIEYGGKRILFDTGNNAEIFAHNVAA